MKIHRIRSSQEFATHFRRNAPYNEQHFRELARYVPLQGTAAFTVPGFSYTAGEKVDFAVDHVHARADGGINWRERVICPVTGLNNRMRASVHLFDIEMNVYPDSTIYLTEQVTPTFRFFAQKFEHVVGSEFLGNTVPYGTTNSSGVRNENLCALTFANAALDAIVSLDVLEHIPNFTDALKECYRCLKPGGRLMWSAPFAPNSERNIVRAVLEPNGTITHLLPPEYHGDPLDREGVLCYTHFGWEVFTQLKSVGFTDAYAIPYQSLEFGYLGHESLMFFATK